MSELLKGNIGDKHSILRRIIEILQNINVLISTTDFEILCQCLNTVSDLIINLSVTNVNLYPFKDFIIIYKGIILHAIKTNTINQIDDTITNMCIYDISHIDEEILELIKKFIKVLSCSILGNL